MWESLLWTALCIAFLFVLGIVFTRLGLCEEPIKSEQVCKVKDYEDDDENDDENEVDKYMNNAGYCFIVGVFAIVGAVGSLLYAFSTLFFAHLDTIIIMFGIIGGISVIFGIFNLLLAASSRMKKSTKKDKK